jgi:aminopeptidase N
VDACTVELKSVYLSCEGTELSLEYNPSEASLRILKNLCLSYLLKSNDPQAAELCEAQLSAAKTMSETLGALTPLASSNVSALKELRETALEKFYDEWKHDSLTISYWFNLHAASQSKDALEQIKNIMSLPTFRKTNPTHILELIYQFATTNPVRFHDISGDAYEFITDTILEIDKINSSSAGYLIRPFTDWQKYDVLRQNKMLTQLMRLHKTPDLSETVRELVDKSLANVLALKNEATTPSHLKLFQPPKLERVLTAILEQDEPQEEKALSL